MGKYRKVYWEYGSNAKASAVEVRCLDLDAGNFAAQETLRAAFEAAVDAVTIGNPGSEQFVATSTDVAKNPSTDTGAQRENKWLVSMVDATNGRPYSFTIPCYDSALIGADGENMDAGAAEYTALVDASEAFARSPVGNLGTVTSVKFSARTI